jgi:glycosyltransferase involved in cell wall biosynthesis
MDVFVLPSYREGFPTVVLEASAMERPVITTKKTGCIDSIVENETGVFVDIEGTSIAEGIERFFDKDNAERMGKNGRKWVVENFEHTIVREAMLNLINELTQNE